MTGPRVFVPYVPSKFDDATRLWVPVINITSAEKFGKLNVLFGPEVSVHASAPMAASMKARMSDFHRDDFLMAVGDPTLIMAMGIYAARNAGGRLKVLKWDRITKDYITVELRT